MKKLKWLNKIKWINVIKAVIFIGCVGVILHDLYMITIHGWITGQLCGWTWFGFMTFILFGIIAGMIYDDFEEQTKSVSTGIRHANVK